MNGFWKQISVWIVMLVLVLLVVSQFGSMRQSKEALLQSDFVEQLDKANIKGPVIITRKGDTAWDVRAPFKNPVKEHTYMEFQTTQFRTEWEAALETQGVKFEYTEQNVFWTGLLINVIPLLLIFGVLWFFMFRQMQGGSNKALSFGKSRARLVNQSEKTVTFNDVAGVDEAKEELQEVVEFLKDPKKFTRLGGKIPRGVLLIGPPGSGKTLLARAVAGEASVPFFSISGSDFVEMFVGVGASRVRDLFQQGHKHAPCIIFIDEIDAVGRQRGAGLGGGHDEREQTLNQLLVEMDGFNTNDGVILMAATNRPDVLDRALLRPGRFDRQIMVTNPDIRGRKQILDIHVRNQKVPIDAAVDPEILARGTPGFSGADLANMVNEAALLAARRGQDKVAMRDFEDAKDRVLMGPARRSLVIGPREKKNTAVHEAGHALVGRLLPATDPVHKATIIPRGPSLGLTSFLPDEDRLNASKQYCLATMRMAMGGRAAEEITYNEYTSGCQSDLQRSTKLAHRMVCDWGMSDLGPISFGQADEVFLGRDFARTRDFSEETAAAVDREVHRFLDEAYRDAKDMLTKHRAVLDALADALYEKETLEADEIDAIIERVGGPGLITPRTGKEDKPKPPPIDATPAPRPVPATEPSFGMPPGIAPDPA